MTDLERYTKVLLVGKNEWTKDDLLVNDELVGYEIVVGFGGLIFDVMGELVEAWSVLG